MKVVHVYCLISTSLKDAVYDHVNLLSFGTKICKFCVCLSEKTALNQKKITMDAVFQKITEIS